MPDLTREYAETCTSNRHWVMYVPSDRDQNVVYTVEFDEVIGGGYDYKCSCPGYRPGYGRRPNRYCKHIKRNMHLHCGWNAHCDPGIKSDKGRCPECGEPAEVCAVEV